MTFTRYTWPPRTAARAVYRAFGTSRQGLADSRRNCPTRMAAVGVLKFLTDASWPEMGKLCGFASHSGPQYAYRRWRKWPQEKRDAALRRVLTHLNGPGPQSSVRNSLSDNGPAGISDQKETGNG